MNLPELITFLIVTGGVGSLLGGTIGLFTAGFTNGAKFGAICGPVAAGCIIIIWGFICNLKNKDSHK